MVSDIKAYPTKTGAMMYAMVVDGNRYGVGNKPPAAKPGDTVSFTATQNGNFLNADVKTLTVVANAAAAVASAGGLSKPVGTASGDYKQDVISRQAAYNTAIAFVQLAVDAGAIPGVGPKTSAVEKYSLLEAMVDQKAEELLQINTDGKTTFPASRNKPAAVASGSDIPPDSGVTGWE
jgi:hypothetical protein